MSAHSLSPLRASLVPGDPFLVLQQLSVSQSQLPRTSGAQAQRSGSESELRQECGGQDRFVYGWMGLSGRAVSEHKGPKTVQA